MTELESHEVVELHFNQNAGTNSNYEYIHVEEMQCDSENTYVIMECVVVVDVEVSLVDEDVVDVEVMYVVAVEVPVVVLAVEVPLGVVEVPPIVDVCEVCLVVALVSDYFPFKFEKVERLNLHIYF